MIELKLYKRMNIKINTEDVDYLEDIREHLSGKKEGYQFVPAFKAGQWDGVTNFFSTSSRSFPYGLFLDYYRFHYEKYRRIKLKVDPKILALFKGYDMKINYNLKYYPYDYQKDIIETAIQKRNGLFISPTASGKSIMISYILQNMFDNHKEMNSVIIVPSTSLVKQFKNDMIDYGMDKNLIGEVYAKKKEWNNPKYQTVLHPNFNLQYPS